MKPQASSCTAKEAEEALSRHPCYSEEAHRFFARMHLPVAPACNIQCNYCNRKFDCVNESRPGVVSEVLTPEQAERKVIAVAAQLLQLSVVGIAGPGDPLANPEQTFDTFRRVKDQVPDVDLCLSTNGLTLYRHVDSIVNLGIGHVTLTINAVDPRIGSEIYRRVVDEGIQYDGIAAAELLISRQLQGLELLAQQGILVKVNSVMIPGVNDYHLPEVSRRVKALGASVHNVTPLIIAPGSRYEQEGRTAPSPKELHALQEILAREGLTIMRHCRQCRADAIGLLGQDRHRDFTMESLEEQPVVDLKARAAFQEGIDAVIRQRLTAKKQRRSAMREEASALKVAVATRGGDKVNQHFGHATEFLVYETDGAAIQLLGVRKIQAYCQGRTDCNGDKAATMQEIIALLSDCRLLLCSGIGEAPRSSLNQHGILPLVRKGNIRETILESVKYSSYFKNTTISKG